MSVRTAFSSCLTRNLRADNYSVIRNPALQRQRSLTLFEVRWSTHLPVGTTHPRYLVGCRLAFGRFPYFLVQRQHLDRDISGLSL
jgi:hypothetical protein